MMMKHRSAPADDVETGRHPLLPLETYNTVRVTDMSQGVAWPGSNFKVAEVLPGSVYLWACGERDDGDGTSPVSRPEKWAAWVILVTQAMCYAGLWYASGNKPRDDANNTEDQDSRTLSILAIAGAMYLLLTIAAADLWVGWALCNEGRDSGGDSFVGRKAFGVFLLGTFASLVGASIRVLFYSSLENVELVIGAAAVLFIADVDEKAMGVLKNVTARWRLFWVLEVIFLSVLLAVFAIKVTENDAAVDKDDGPSLGEDYCKFGGCSVYGWFLIVYTHPMAVTVCALLVSGIVSMPEQTLTWRALRPSSPGWFAFLFVMCLWIAEGALAPFYLLGPFFYVFLNLVAFGIMFVLLVVSIVSAKSPRFRERIVVPHRAAVLFAVLLWIFHLTILVGFDSAGLAILVLEIVVFGGLVVLIVLAMSARCRERIMPHMPHAVRRFLTRAGRGELPTLLAHAIRVGSLHKLLGVIVPLSICDFFFQTDGGLRSGMYLSIGMWLIFGMLNASTCMHPVGNSLPVPRLEWVVLGWAISQQFRYSLLWELALGACLWREEPGSYGVVFWAAATVLRDVIAHCAYTWTSAFMDGTVT